MGIISEPTYVPKCHCSCQKFQKLCRHSKDKDTSNNLVLTCMGVNCRALTSVARKSAERNEQLVDSFLSVTIFYLMVSVVVLLKLKIKFNKFNYYSL